MKHWFTVVDCPNCKKPIALDDLGLVEDENTRPAPLVKEWAALHINCGTCPERVSFTWDDVYLCIVDNPNPNIIGLKNFS
jgi:hypothetical protein